MGEVSHTTIDLLFAVTGQSLYFDAPEGRASSVTSSTVYENTSGDDGTAVSATTGSAAVETTPNTTFDALSGDGQTDPRKCNLTATTSTAVGRVFLATNATLEKEWIEVAAIASADYIIAKEPLRNAFTTADTFVSTRITHAISSTWVADASYISAEFTPNPRYRWRLVYVVSSVTYVHDLYFDLLRYAGRHDVTPMAVRQKFPQWLDSLPTYDREDQGAALIADAYQELKWDLYQELKPDSSFRNREVVNDLVALKAAELGGMDGAAERYKNRFAQLVHWTKVPFSVDAGAGARKVPALPLWRR